MTNRMASKPSARFRRFAAVLLLGIIGWAFAACTPASAKITVAASILPLGDFCQKIGGNHIEVKVLLPPGASPHVFEPLPTTVAEATKARVFVYVGAGLDPWAARLLKAQRTPGQVVVEAVAGIPLLRDVGGHDHDSPAPGGHEEGESHGHEPGNPHVWLDPVLAQDICRRIAQALVQVDPAPKPDYEQNLAHYLLELQELDRDIRRTVAGLRHKDYICFHPAFAYFARRYGLKEVGVIEASPGREPSPGHLQTIIDTIKKTGVKAVFAEPQLNPRVAEIIAREAGIKVLFLDPLGGRPPYGSDYIKLMRHNLAVLSQALQ